MVGARRQTTVERTAQCDGVGVHTGRNVRVRLTPAEAETGIVFVRVDQPDAPEVAARPESVNHAALARRTELVGPDAAAAVATPEHLLAACLALGLDCVRVEVDGPELPIFDGSASPYVALIREAGLKSLAAPRRVWRLERPVSLVADSAEIHAIPAEGMRVAFFARFPPQSGLAAQAAQFALDAGGDAFADEVAPARTFCFYEEVQALQAAGLIRGGSLDCALVLRDGRPMETDYRLPDELARHKLLDLFGDLAILGRPVAAWITARGSGHALNHRFIRDLTKELTPS